MKSVFTFAAVILIGVAAILAQSDKSKPKQKQDATSQQKPNVHVTSDQINMAVEKGADWLASVQGADGGWGQDGGENKYVRKDVGLESQSNDVANTAVAALALLRAGNKYRPNVDRAADFILKKIESAPADGLSITDVNNTQIQRKLGPYIDTFLATMLLTQVDGTLAKTQNTRLRSGLEKCVAKIEQNQMKDGSWNIAGGWAPILSTSLASRSLYAAQKKGVKVNQDVVSKANTYTLNNQKAKATASGGASSTGAGALTDKGRDTIRRSEAVSVVAVSAGVDIYEESQALEQLSRTDEDRKKNATEIKKITGKLRDSNYVAGYGSIGGEEFFSYLNISDSLKRSSGKEWNEWHTKISSNILKTQNNDGTWAGHHCITGRVAVTAAAILNLIPGNENS